MIGNKSVLGLIPARGGSKGIPRKNIKKAAGKPLIAWTIEEAKKSKYIDRLILTSEDREIIEVARSFGCEAPFVRPAHLAADDTPGIDPVIHAVKNVNPHDYVVTLQPTSPLRSAEDIDGCIEKCFQHKANACVTVTEVDKSPYWMYELDNRDYMIPILQSKEQVLRRQDSPKILSLNGAVYVAATTWLEKTKSFLTEETIAYEMPQARSLDIDQIQDLKYFEMIKNS